MTILWIAINLFMVYSGITYENGIFWIVQVIFVVCMLKKDDFAFKDFYINPLFIIRVLVAIVTPIILFSLIKVEVPLSEYLAEKLMRKMYNLF